MAAWSKILDCSCYELGHTWTPSCKQATYDIALHGFKESFKIYAPLYLITAILKRRGKGYYITKLLPEILRSTAFLGCNAFLFISSFCVWRKFVGFYVFFNVFACGIPATTFAWLLESSDRKGRGDFSFLSTSFLPANVAAFIAICLERKLRRGMLALYMGNVAVETAYRMAVSRGIVSPIRNGEVLMFSVVMAVYMYLFRCRNGLNKSISSGIRMLVGGSEQPVNDENSNTTRPSVSPGRGSPVPKAHGTGGWLSYLPPELQVLVQRFRQGPQHPLCRHRHSCIASVVEGSVRLFGVGYIIQAAVKILGGIPVILRKPSHIINMLKHTDNAKLGAFLATFCGVFKGVSCLLRWLRDRDDPRHGLLAGFLAGWAMMFYKSSTIALYLTSKLAETLYFKGIDSGHLPYIKWADAIIYSLSTSFVFHAAVFEPHNLRPAYWKFLLRLTNNRFAEMNRQLLDVFGTNASKMFSDFYPKYDPAFTKLAR